MQEERRDTSPRGPLMEEAIDPLSMARYLGVLLEIQQDVLQLLTKMESKLIDRQQY